MIQSATFTLDLQALLITDTSIMKNKLNGFHAYIHPHAHLKG